MRRLTSIPQFRTRANGLEVCLALQPSLVDKSGCGLYCTSNRTPLVSPRFRTGRGTKTHQYEIPHLFRG